MPKWDPEMDDEPILSKGDRGLNLSPDISSIQEGYVTVSPEPLPLPKFYLRRQYVVVALCTLGTMLIYTLRVNLSMAIIPISKENDYNSDFQGQLLSSFFWGYIVTQIPGGMLAGRFGSKVVFGLGIFWTCLCTVGLPFVATSPRLLLLSRILTGLGEGVTYPSLHLLLGKWIPEKDLGFFLPVIWGGAPLGTCLSLLTGPSIILAWGWRTYFFLYGGIGMLWCILWTVLISDGPMETSRLSLLSTHPHEAKHIVETAPYYHKTSKTVTWSVIAKLAVQPSVWAVCTANFSNNWVWYVILSWTPTYIVNSLDFPFKSSGVLSMLCCLALWAVSLVAGKTIDSYISRGVPKTIMRKLPFCGGGFLCAICLGFLPYSNNRTVAIVLLTVAGGALGLALPGWAVNHHDIAPSFSGLLLGASNSFGTVSGIVSVWLTGVQIQEYENPWPWVFGLASIMSMFGVVVFAVFGSAARIDLPE